jgi:type IV pilus assembly protein PilQ
MRLFLCLFLFAVFTFSGVGYGQEPAREKVSLDIKGMDIIDVLKMLGSKADLNMAIDKNVSGRVTVFLKDVSPEEALNVILASNDLVREKQGRIIRIMTAQDYEKAHGVPYRDFKAMLRIRLRYARPQDLFLVLNQMKSKLGAIIADESTAALVLFDTREKIKQMVAVIRQMDAPVATEIYDLNYARCEKIAEFLQSEVTKGPGEVKTDTRMNKVIVTDYVSKLKELKALISRLDEQTREVLIDARIVQVNLSDKTSLGIDWEYVLNKKLNVGAMFGQMITTTGNKWTIGTAAPKDRNDYSAVIEALKTIGDTKILSSPRLTVTNNEQAKILVGSKQVYVTSSAIQSQTSTQTAEAVNFVDVGVKLFVTPTISPDGFVLLKIRPEVSSVVQTYKTSTGNLIPIVETSEAETTVLVEDGATLIIGGLMKDEKSKSINKIPFLGDIPLLGRLFRNSAEEIKKTELVIFLTCKIMDFKARYSAKPAGHL